MLEGASAIEERRLFLQARLDSAKDRVQRNKMGQFATPAALAIDILKATRPLLSTSNPIRFIDPAIGTGAFFSALMQVYPTDSVSRAVGYEVDSHYGLPAMELWSSSILELRLEDFTLASPPHRGENKFNLLICNPPYVRHHHMTSEKKTRLKCEVKKTTGLELSGLAGLYCYFLCLSHSWMSDDGVAAWLMPSEFMNVNYGMSIRRYLVDQVTLLRVHRYDPEDVQFGDALVSSSVVFIKKGKSSSNHLVRMTVGGSLNHPRRDRFVSKDALRADDGWTQHSWNRDHSGPGTPVLGDYFRIQRGLATGNNSYFILTPEEIEKRNLPWEAFRPILPGPRYILSDEIFAGPSGDPLVSRRVFLLDCALREDAIKDWSPSLSAYLDEGIQEGVADGYLCRHRIPWYSQERRPAAPFLCSYIGRDTRHGRPFRFIMNHSHATAPNTYLMLYPRESLARVLEERPEVKRLIWAFLQGISLDALIGKGRVYGGGLHKMEPRELGRVSAAGLSDVMV